jgi:hypothetical protein
VTGTSVDETIVLTLVSQVANWKVHDAIGIGVRGQGTTTINVALIR